MPASPAIAHLTTITVAGPLRLSVAHHVGQSGKHWFHLLVPEQGSVVFAPDGAPSRVVTHGSATLVDDDSLAYSTAETDPQITVLSFPGEAIEVPLGQLRRCTGNILDVREGVPYALVSLLHSLAALDSGNSDLTLHLGSAVMSLLMAALTASDALPGEPTRTEAMMMAFSRTIEENLGNPDLGPDMLARQHHVSTSYVHKLFASQGLRVGTHVRARRCEKARRLLADPGGRDEPIARIAEVAGFRSAAHFTRVFTSQYGVNPRDYRRATMGTVRPAPTMYSEGQEPSSDGQPLPGRDA